ncbi:gpi-anchored wall transfer protein 1 [Lichtheimia corymbifera JMRC:FSU:9682]|uniref:GPI-anchored wall transfer protein n=1 Tax=Lichtheimia corymbifera JMRC:FSU:9682 TaxID=1263082 RepID=A0A068RE70_9FUNG|nr:gpi-anchored wall transfer protein 1 [Lichtheimia corymbifera JMRC:FSU:9682]
MLRDDEEYKRAQEAWVSNCTGGSITEILSVVTSLVASHLLWSTLSLHSSIPSQNLFIQIVIYVVPVLLSQTVAADHAILVALALVSMSFLFSRITPSSPQQTPESSQFYKSYLTVYRAGIMMVTCMAILAVDFPIFPRRFAKVETFGTSLMDVGVGSVVFSSGIVASRAYLNRHPVPRMMAMIKAFRSALPILTLGFLRFILTKGVDYQEHTSEYGLHWNFFFTLGFLPPFVTLASFMQQWVSFSALAMVIASAYQLALYYGLQSWILDAPRVDILSANKEGICSFIGYVAIFLLGLESGMIIFRNDLSQSSLVRWLGVKPDAPNSKHVGVHLMVQACALWTLLGCWWWYLCSGDENEMFNVSRRMANLPYVIWVVAFNLTLLGWLVWVEYLYPVPGRGPSLLDAVNVNGLVTFLWANILTGLVNLSMRTLYASTIQSLAVCFIYITVVALLPWILWRHYNIRVKL